MAIDHDRLFKGLLQEFLYEFLELFFPTMAAFVDRKSIKFRDQEVMSSLGSGGVYRVDLVAEARMAGRDTLVLLHVEPQAQQQAGFARRMLQYYAHLYEKFDLPIYPVALFSFEKPLRSEPVEHLVDFPDGDVLRFRFRAVQLNRLRWRDYLRRWNPVAAALMTRMQVAPEDRPRMKAHCLKLLAGLPVTDAQARRLGHFVDTYAPLDAEGQQVMLDEIRGMSPEEADMTLEYMPSWEKAGYDRGKAEGARAMLLRVLARRFGGLPGDLEEHLMGLTDLARLEALGDLAVEVADLDAFRRGMEAASE